MSSQPALAGSKKTQLKSIKKQNRKGLSGLTTQPEISKLWFSFAMFFPRAKHGPCGLKTGKEPLPDGPRLSRCVPDSPRANLEPPGASVQVEAPFSLAWSTAPSG